MGLGEVLHGLRSATVRVALTQHRVHGRTLDLVVACPNIPLLIGRRLFRVGRQVVALRLQFGDRRLQLRDGSGDVGQLDDVGIGGLGEIAQLGQSVADLLVFGQAVVELGQHARGERDVSSLNLDTGRRGEGFDDGFERIRREKRRFIRARVNDFSHS